MARHRPSPSEPFGLGPSLSRVAGEGILFLALAFLAVSARAEDGRPLVVATTPDLKSLTAAVGGDLVRVAALVPDGVDGEGFEPRPRHLALLRDAVLVVRVGLGYDDWLDPLLVRNGDARLRRGGIGQVDASIGIPLLEVRGSSVDPTGGHPHGLANPHYWLDPANAEPVTAAIAEGLIRVMPEAAERFVANRDRFLAALAPRRAGWEMALASFRGVALVGYHNSWPYFARRFHLDIVDTVEPKEGVAPSPARLAHIAAAMRERAVRAVVVETWSPQDGAQALAARTGTAVAVLVPSVGAAPGASDYAGLFDVDVAALRDALGER